MREKNDQTSTSNDRRPPNIIRPPICIGYLILDSCCVGYVRFSLIARSVMLWLLSIFLLPRRRNGRPFSNNKAVIRRPTITALRGVSLPNL